MSLRASRSRSEFVSRPGSCLSSQLRALVAFVSCIAASPSAASSIDLVDVTSATGIEFVTSYGPVLSNEMGSPFCGPLDLIKQQENMGNGAAVGDYDDDGDLDIYLLGNNSVGNKLYRNDWVEAGTKTFTDVTIDAFGLEPEAVQDLGISRVAHFVDLDNDGRLDLLVVNDDDVTITDELDPLYGPSRIFENTGNGTFSDVTSASGFRPDGYIHAGTAIADYDADGLLDIYVTVWTGVDLLGPGSRAFPGRNHLYKNLGNFVFQRVTNAAGLSGLNINSFTSILHDLDEDADADLFFAVDFGLDRFFKNLGNGTFENATTESEIVHVANDMGVAVADYDNDDDLDLYVTNISLQPGGTSQLGNAFWRAELIEGGVRYDDLAAGLGVRDSFWGWGTEFVDLENDGDLDLLAANGFDAVAEYCGETTGYYYQAPTVLFENLGTTFERKVGELDPSPGADSRALIAFDYDRDGDQDVLITNVDQDILFFENQSSAQGNWLDVAVSPDYCAIGATVRAFFGVDGFMRRDIIAGRSYLAGTPSEVHFGFGAVASIDRIEIELPDQQVIVRNDVALNQVLRVDCALPEPDARLLSLWSLLALAWHRRRRA